MLVVYINNDKVRHFITCDSDMMSLHALSSCVLGAWLCKDPRQEGVGVNEIMSCVYCSTERTTDTRFVYFLFQRTYILIMYWYT